MLKKLKSTYLFRIIIILCVAALPMVYSALYLSSIWNPYYKLASLPVAVVNNDTGATLNGIQRNLGQEMCVRLKENGALKFVFTNDADAKIGTAGSKYYATVTIPADFSSNISSVATEKKQTASIIYSPNQKHNYFGYQILTKAVMEIEKSTVASVDKEIVNQLSNKLKSTPDQLSELQSGLNQLYTGSASLTEGTETFSSKFSEYQNGTKALDSGINDLLSGANQLDLATTDLTKLSSASSELAKQTNSFNQGVVSYTTGVNTLIGTFKATIASTSNLFAYLKTTEYKGMFTDPKVQAYLASLQAFQNPDSAQAKALAQLEASTLQLKASSEKLAQATQTLSDKTSSLSQLRGGILQLKDGLTSAKAGSLKLNEAATQLNTAAASINTGSGTLTKGIKTASTGVDTAVSDANTQVKSLNGIGAYAEAPVKLVENEVYAVPNYGTAFAPYFIPISLWIGGIIAFIGILSDSEEKIHIMSMNSKHKIARSFIYLGLSVIQGLILAAVMISCLKLQVNNVTLFYLSCCLVSMTFTSIIQFLLVYLKDLGKFLSVVFLVFQLTSCGGTFPMEIMPKLFQTLNPYMPMTYAVTLFKEIISGGTMSAILNNSRILAAIFIVFFGTTLALSLVNYKRIRARVAIMEQ